MAKVFAELKRRQMFRVAAAYAVVAWLLLQIVNNVAPVLDLPVWVARAFLLALVIGFPIALLFVWMRDLPPTDAAAPKATTTNLDYALIGALTLVIALVSYQQLAPTAGEGTSPGGPQSQAAGLSIAVMPFENLSSDAEQEFFSVGMSDEIMAALAKVQSLTIVARESAHQYKGERNDMRAVGRALNAKYLINGSVRRAGNRVRITAQLVRTDDGVGLWTDSYDRELTDVFAIQEDIARAIAASLSVPLGLQQGETLVSNRTGSPESYDQYLRAQALVRARSLPEAITLLETVVARDPGFAPAWGLLARAYSSAPFYVSPEKVRLVLQSSRDKAQKAGGEAVRLDSRNAIGYAALATVQQQRGNWAASEDLFRQALALDPNEPEALHTYSNNTLGPAGRLKEALSLRERLRTLEPFVPVYNIFTAAFMQYNGLSQASIPILEATPVDAAGGFTRNVFLAQAYAAEGRYAEASDTLLAMRTNVVNRGSVEEAARLLRSAPTTIKTPEALPLLEARLGFVYAYVGAPDRVLESFERESEIEGGVSTSIWLPLHAPLRKTERFKAFVRKAGLVDYWRARGWPDLCRPAGADDFVCD